MGDRIRIVYCVQSSLHSNMLYIFTVSKRRDINGFKLVQASERIEMLSSNMNFDDST